MKMLQLAVTRRLFLQLCATLPVTLSGLQGKRQTASVAQPASPPVGYGVGAYGQHTYPGMSNNLYLPLVSKVQE